MRVFPEVPLDPVVDAVLVDQAVLVHAVDGDRAKLKFREKASGQLLAAKNTQKIKIVAGLTPSILY